MKFNMVHLEISDPKQGESDSVFGKTFSFQVSSSTGGGDTVDGSDILHRLGCIRPCK